MRWILSSHEIAIQLFVVVAPVPSIASEHLLLVPGNYSALTLIKHMKVSAQMIKIWKFKLKKHAKSTKTAVGTSGIRGTICLNFFARKISYTRWNFRPEGVSREWFFDDFSLYFSIISSYFVILPLKTERANKNLSSEWSERENISTTWKSAHIR